MTKAAFKLLGSLSWSPQKQLKCQSSVLKQKFVWQSIALRDKTCSKVFQDVIFHSNFLWINLPVFLRSNESGCCFCDGYLLVLPLFICSCKAMAGDKSAFVVVLGDLGRSPRMCNHAQSLANEGFSVTLLGYAGSSLKSEITGHSLIRVQTMSTFPASLSRSLPRLLCYVLKVFWQTLLLFFALPFLSGPDFIFLQNPPTIPPLVVCYIYTFFHPGKVRLFVLSLPRQY